MNTNTAAAMTAQFLKHVACSAPQDTACDHLPAAQIQVDDERCLMDSLLDLAQRQLRREGLSVDRQHAQMTLSGAGVPSGVFEVRPCWNAGSGLPAQPLRFELRDVASAGIDGVREVYLSAPVTRDAMETVRRLRKDSPSPRDGVRADDLGEPFDVAAGSRIVVTAVRSGMKVSTIATASVDAHVGERIDVRLQHPTRTLAVRVTGNGTAELMELSA